MTCINCIFISKYIFFKHIFMVRNCEWRKSLDNMGLISNCPNNGSKY